MDSEIIILLICFNHAFIKSQEADPNESKRGESTIIYLPTSRLHCIVIGSKTGSD